MVNIEKNMVLVASQSDAELEEHLAKISEASKTEHAPCLAAHLGAAALHSALMLVVSGGAKAKRPIEIRTEYCEIRLVCGSRIAKIEHTLSRTHVTVTLLGGNRTDIETQWTPKIFDLKEIHREAAKHANRIGRHLMGAND